jgi:hypothetical protein
VLIDRANQSARELEAVAASLKLQSDSLMRKAAQLRKAALLATSGAADGNTSADGADGMAVDAAAISDVASLDDTNSKTADAGGADPRPVDFKTTWPPGHHESPACRAVGSKAGEQVILTADDPLVIKYGDDLIGPFGGNPE